jgi:hypothetical protein
LNFLERFKKKYSSNSMKNRSEVAELFHAEVQVGQGDKYNSANNGISAILPMPLGGDPTAT